MLACELSALKQLFKLEELSKMRKLTPPQKVDIVSIKASIHPLSTKDLQDSEKKVILSKLKDESILKNWK